MYKLFPLIILIITQATSPTIASEHRNGSQIEVRNGSQTENRSGNQTEVRLPPPAHDNMGGVGRQPTASVFRCRYCHRHTDCVHDGSCLCRKATEKGEPERTEPGKD